MVLKQAEFIRSAAQLADFPTDRQPHIVFAGRSNVGKSSTINALVGRRGFARVSSSPGKTVFVNLFQIERRFWLVDLPGYGYSKTSKAERQRYSQLIDQYLEHARDRIAKLYIIVDIRHEPTADDLMMAEWARSLALPFTVIANKMDKLKPAQIESSLQTVRDTLELENSVTTIAFSAEKSTGRDQVIGDIYESLGENP